MCSACICSHVSGLVHIHSRLRSLARRAWRIVSPHGNSPAHSSGRSTFTLITLSLLLTLASTSSPIALRAQILSSVAAPHFIENSGQWPDRVRFLALLGGLNVWITDDAILYDFHRAHSAAALRRLSDGPSEYPFTGGHVIAMRFGAATQAGSREIPCAGERPDPSLARTGNDAPHERRAIYGVDPLAVPYTYIDGRRGSEAIRAARYEGLRIDDVGDGVAMRLYFDGGALRYDLVVPAGFDPAAIHLTIEGGDSIRLNGAGELAIATSLGDVLQRRLCAFQEYAGIRRHVDCRFRLHRDGTVGFEMGNYDSARPVVIDPLVWSTFVGGEGDERSTGIARGANGALFVTGYTTSNNFPATLGAYDTSPDGVPSAFVLKLSGDGGTLHYATFIGGEGGAWSMGIAVDAAGCAHIAGFAGAGYPTTVGAPQRSLAGAVDAFATKLNASGSALLYSTLLGGSGVDRANAIALDTAGRICLAGGTSSSDFPTTSGAYRRVPGGGLDIFCSRIAPSGASENDLQYSTMAGGSASESGYGLALDDAGNFYVAGASGSSNYPTTAGAFDTSRNGDSDAVLMVIAPRAHGDTDLIYSTFIGGAGNDCARAIARDNSSGTIVLAGVTASADFPVTPGAFDTAYNGGASDGFCLTMTPSGGGASDLHYSTYIGGSGADALNSCATDGASGFVAAGGSASSNFPTTPGAYDASANGDTDVVLVRIIPQGFGDNDLLYATYIGGSGADEALACAMRGPDTIVVAGGTSSSGFPTTAGAYDMGFNGGRDAMVALLAPGEGRTAFRRIGGSVTQGFEREDRAPDNATVTLRCTPVPARDRVRIEYRLQAPGRTRVELRGLGGAAVATVVDAWHEAGSYAADLDVSALPSGIFIVTVTREGERSTKAIVIAR